MTFPTFDIPHSGAFTLAKDSIPHPNPLLLASTVPHLLPLQLSNRLSMGNYTGLPQTLLCLDHDSGRRGKALTPERLPALPPALNSS